jgi:hypothetical protein
MIGVLSGKLPPNHTPSEMQTVLEPRLIELCFQTAGLWEMGQQSRMGLPLHIDRVTLFAPIGSATGPLYAVVTPNMHDESFDAQIIDSKGDCYLELAGYRTVAVPNSLLNDDWLKPLRTLFVPELVAAD